MYSNKVLERTVSCLRRPTSAPCGSAKWCLRYALTDTCYVHFRKHITIAQRMLLKDSEHILITITVHILEFNNRLIKLMDGSLLICKFPEFWNLVLNIFVSPIVPGKVPGKLYTLNKYLMCALFLHQTNLSS